jgi:hypothetical protein
MFSELKFSVHGKNVSMRLAATLIALCLTWTVSSSAIADPLAWWRFEQATDRTTPDDVTRLADKIEGRFKLLDGVVGKALKCDGFTTCVIRQAKHAPTLGDAWTIEAWVAIQAYPWGWCPIVAQRKNRQTGYMFGIDAEGHLGLHLAIDGKWQACTSETRIPLMTWHHVAGTFDKNRGIVLFVDGQQVANLEVKGSPTYADDVDLRIARNHAAEPAQFSAYWDAPDQPVYFSFDGLLDEIKIHDRNLSDDEIRTAFDIGRTAPPPPFKPRWLPSGPADANTFGAFYEHLKYSEEWDAQWRGSGPDVVVAFEFAPVRLVFWRGISYAPCWVTEKGNWQSNEFVERGIDRKTRGCSESMSDKQARFSHVKILENSDARAVVYWRNSPVGINYEFAYVDPATGWGDWSEEYHTIYPDGVAVRKVILYSTNLEAWYEWCQSIQPLHPGQRPEDILDEKRVMSVANMKGEQKTFGWPSGTKRGGYPTIPGANVQVTYLKSTWNPFLVMDDRPGRNVNGGIGPSIHRFGGKWSRHSNFPWRNHWPVTQVPVLGRHAQAADRPAHTYTATQRSAPYETTDHSVTKIVLCGMTDKNAKQLLPLARSWLRAPKLTIDSDAYINKGYDQTQRAYVLQCKKPGQPSTVVLHFAASAQSPLRNLAVIVRNWGQTKASVTVEGQEKLSYRTGYHRHLEGTDLAVWVEVESNQPTQVTLTPVDK